MVNQSALPTLHVGSLPVNTLDIEAATVRIAELWDGLKRCTWELAMILLDVETRQTWRDAVDRDRRRNCTSWSNWVDVCTPIHRSTASQLRQAASAVMALPESEQQRWLSDTEPLRVYPLREIVAKDPERAYSLAAGTHTRGQLFDQAAAELPDSHREAGLRRIVATVTVERRDEWQRALNVARFIACKSHPTDDDLIGCVAQCLLQEPLPPAVEKFRLQIESGDYQCVACLEEGAHNYNAADLEWHHVIARSAGGHDGPLVLLCRDCHRRIQPTWREWAERHGFTTESGGEK